MEYFESRVNRFADMVDVGCDNKMLQVAGGGEGQYLSGGQV